jgi:type I restriction enzyme S subunit
MSKVKIIPELRFPEFKNDGDWENKPLDDLCKLVRGPFGGALKKEIFVQKGYAVYEQSHAIYSDFNSFRYRIEEGKFSELKRFSVRASDLIMSCSGTMGKFAIIPKNHEQGIINQALLKLTIKKGFDIWFVKISLETEHNQNKLLSQSAGGAIKNVVSVSQIKELELAVPKLPEQQKIASCLSSLDEIIATHSQKLNLLKDHKKGMMQNLFPQEGETVPKYRFKEFENDGEWVEKTLNEITPLIFDGTHQTPKYTENGIPFFSVENLISGKKNKFISKEDYIIATNKNKPEKFDILITRIGNIGFPKVIDWDYEFSIYVTLAVIKKSKEFNSYYLHSFIQSDFYQKEIKSKSLLNATPCKINMDELRKTKILLPPDKEHKEQQKIASCLSSLDALITAQGEKIEQLKLHKKGLMQGLFPKIEI